MGRSQTSVPLPSQIPLLESADWGTGSCATLLSHPMGHRCGSWVEGQRMGTAQCLGEHVVAWDGVAGEGWGKNKNPPKRGQSGAFLKGLWRTWAACLLASEGPVWRLGVATETRVHGGVATEMKALANNLQRGGGGGSWGPVLISCAGRVAQCGTMHLQGSLCCCCRPWGDGEGVTPARTRRLLLGEPGREEGEAPGEGAR